MRRIILGLLQNWGAEGSAWGPSTSVTVGVSGASENVVIPQGVWFVQTDAHCTVGVVYDGGSFGTSGHYITWVPTSSVGMVYSDGFAVSFIGDGTLATGQRTQIFPLA